MKNINKGSAGSRGYRRILTVCRILLVVTVICATILLCGSSKAEAPHAAGPFSKISTDKGFDLKLINKYLDFADKHLDGLSGFVSGLRYVDVAALFTSDNNSTAIGKSNTLMEFYKKYRPLIRSVLRADEDRTYIIVAQNTAEMRASGGFPGAVGSINIKDGYLQIGDFDSVYASFERLNAHVVPHNDVSKLISGAFPYTWDMCFCPDFPEVARIWADAYARRNGVEVSGVISLTPHLIQDMLDVYGGIKLSDGTKLDGDYTIEFISHDIYMKYIYKGANADEGNRMTDKLFYETAKKTLKKVTDDLGAGKLARIAGIVEKRVADGCIQVYMCDPQEQEYVRELGMDGELPLDPQDPVLGMFFSVQTASKMGWYIDAEYSVGEPVVNEDGSRTYDVSLSYSHTISQYDIDNASKYVLGDYANGKFYGYNVLTAPAGGKITDLSFTPWNDSNHEINYKGLQCYRLSGYWLPNTTVEYSFKVTTAPGVDAPLKVQTTPTYREYRK